MTQIIAIAGEKQSGKNTTCNFITMMKLAEYGISKKTRLTDTGEIEVTDIFGEKIAGMDWFPLNHPMVNVDGLFNENAHICKIYAFADKLKRFLVEVLGLPFSSIYGTDDEKNAKTTYRWQDMPGVIGSRDTYKKAAAEIKRNTVFRRDGFMSGRDFMQWFGTDVCRLIKDDIWLSATLSQIKEEKPEIALISDCRFDNEIQAVKDIGGFVLGLTRKIDTTEDQKKHRSEKIDLSLCSVVVDNADKTISEANEMIYNEIKHLAYIPNIMGE